MDSYICPDPTPEQIALADELNYDPYDRCGDGITDTSACDTLCAACLIHDELFLRGGNKQQRDKVNKNFARDCEIIALAVDCLLLREAVLIEMFAYIEVVDNFSRIFWHGYDRNTDVTRAQSELTLRDAKLWINTCALKIGKAAPYTEVL